MTESKIVEIYAEEPMFFREWQTTMDGYKWEKKDDRYVRIYQGAWDERSH